MKSLRVLIAHNRYLISGGEDQSCKAEILLLKERGFDVDEYYEDNSTVDEIGKVRTALRTIWSKKSYDFVHNKLTNNRYDFILVQNFFPLISPSIYYASEIHKVPVIQFLRNYRLLCINGFLFRNNNICNDCVGKKLCLPGIIHKCYRGSLPGSVTVALMIFSHHMMKTWSHKIDRYIALANFAKKRFTEGGLPENKIEVRPNFVHPDPGVGSGSGKFAVFVGRLSPEKGLDTVLTAWKRIGRKIPLKIVGPGTQNTQMDGVEFLGKRTQSEVLSIIGQASVLIFPSLWYEGFGRSIIEAYSKGTPVIASNLGTMSELVRDGETGYHFEPGNASDLASTVDFLFSNPKLLVKIRKNAREEYEMKYTADICFNKLLEIFQNLGAKEL